MSAIRSILLVDDDIDDQFVFIDALSTVNPAIAVDTAADGIDALEKLSHAPLPQVIFVDLNMPRMNGKKFLEEVKASPGLASIPVIVYSTSSSPEDISETKAIGASEFIIKPNSYDELCKILSSTLNNGFQHSQE